MFNSLLDLIRAHRRRTVHRKLFEGDRKEFFEKIYKGNSGACVLAGPFRGMAYLNTSDFGPIAPKWLGSYETEIQDLVGEVCTRGYKSIINIGSAEGYYAVGFARASTGSRIVAFDIDPFARWALATLAHINGVVDRVEIRRICTWNLLEDLQSEKQLLFVDIEGGEMDLLDPRECEALYRSDLLVELHHSRDIGDDIEKTICNRFKQTHDIRRRQQMDRSEWLSINRQVWEKLLSEEEAVRATNEFRTDRQAWLWLEVKR